MNLVAVGLGVFLVAFAVYIVGDPVNRVRLWTATREYERDPTGAKETQRTRTVVYATAVGATGLLFVALGVAL
ncbi:hypothetical protein I7X12_13605 [Halosimplex litoreum]|uniref:Uncharacterized protein n=1 Tax=Halosimplex litoreum TaxID=1198301 RepID=A0A7T3FW71_9EURY|nr:hypothetical protein [Halosimplex litoreum]QPV61781.1 hypothetical protein I7X12_13605 [Halosimplex litoreum]